MSGSENSSELLLRFASSPSVLSIRQILLDVSVRMQLNPFSQEWRYE